MLCFTICAYTSVYGSYNSIDKLKNIVSSLKQKLFLWFFAKQSLIKYAKILRLIFILQVVLTNILMLSLIVFYTASQIKAIYVRHQSDM